MSLNFTAAPQALGYIYQLRYALFNLLSEPETAEVSIEKLDDIAFVSEGDPYQILQLKRLGQPVALTNRSLELWKTIRVWSTLIKNREVKIPETIFILVSTAKAAEDSIASFLRPGKERNDELAYQKLLVEATSLQNQNLTDDTLQKCFNVFLSLTDTDRNNFVKSIRILDSALDIFDIPAEIQKNFLTAVRRESRSPLYERLEGWWFNKMIDHLGGKTTERAIPRYEVEDKIADLAEQFQPGSLPIDFFDKSPEIPEDAKQRMFVVQLKEIEISSGRIEKAIQDYYKAVEQRSRWARNELLFGDEIERFERKLIDEWERFSAAFFEEVSNKGSPQISGENVQEIVYV